ncbi:hypothetical protein K7472_19100 [Streptomyces sp. PTM05]|uniref:Uncharacterized protein n=1 Tax=Streptantibioticus parmotrematis TaxID=2873249 RepID=A0ABS7QX58_9ACTN|nr:hypothetical protein [Streptantibioticus parmotrematis]MBY8886950.1 hypothetical protein [Streptantibioticus parmotrematis]
MAQLRRLKEQSALSYRQLERTATRNGDVLPASTLATALNRGTLPREDLLTAFVRACGADPADWVATRRRLERGIPPGTPTATDPNATAATAPDEAAAEPEVPAASRASDRAPRLLLRGVLTGMAVLTAVTVVAILAVPGFFSFRHASNADATTGSCQGQDLRMDTATGECWGVSGGTTAFTPSSRPLADVVKVIDQQNRTGAADHLRQPERPYVTLAYVGALTSRDSFPTTLVAERETLEGIAAAQRLSLERETPGAPLVNVLVVNGAAGMAHGVEAADLLARWPRGTGASGPPAIGVVGLDQSRTQTLRTIREFGRQGVPMMAAALSADQFASASPMYFQVAPQDRWAAAVDTAFLTAGDGAGARSVRIYASADPDDLYSRNLTADLRAALAAKGVAVQQAAFRPAFSRPGGPPSADGAGATACGYPGTVYYAGRAEDFGDFLNGIYSTCGDTPPRILTDDDITRYVADPRLRGMYRSVPFHYTSFAIAPQTCEQGAGNTFYATLDTLFPFECDGNEGRSLDGHAALGYDATLTMLTAIENLGPSATRAGLARALGGLRIGGAASAPITIGPDHVPVRKMVAILTVAHGRPPTLEGSCGDSAPDEARWCADAPGLP